jgi:hypothetical protein
MTQVNVPNPNPNDTDLTLRDLAIHAATKAKLDSFTDAYEPNSTKADRMADTFAKTCPPLTRLILTCDSGLVKQIGFYKPNKTIATISCPFPATNSNKEDVIAGSLGDKFDIICPVTIRMRDMRGFVISITQAKTLAKTKYNMPTSSTDPLEEEGPPTGEPETIVPPGPDRIHIDINNTNETPCFIAIPKVFPLTDGYTIPQSDTNISDIINLTQISDNTNKTHSAILNRDDFKIWNAAMNYGMKHLNNYSIHAKNTLFVYDNINKDDFDINKENLVSQFTTQVTYLTPEDPLYHEVTKHTLNEKDKAIQNFGSNSRSTTNPTPTPPTEINTTTNSPHSVVSDMSTMIEGFAKAITDSTSKNLTGNEKERITEALEAQQFYELLFASSNDTIQPNGTTVQTFIKATVNPLFISGVLKANKNSKATRAMQDIIEETTASLSNNDNRFAAASNLTPRMFDQPLTAALRTGIWEHQHTVLHPDGLKTHFGIHHIAPPKSWSATYKTRLAGEMKIIQQEQVEEDKTKINTKNTELYHMGRVGTISALNETIGNFFALMYSIIEYNQETPPTIWLELTAFDRILRTPEGRQWCDLHHKAPEVIFNVTQDIQSTIAGFVAEARRAGYKKGLAEGVKISPKIFQLPMQQGTELRRKLQNTVLTMSALHYQETPITFKLFFPEQLQKDNNNNSNSNKKRDTNATPATDAQQPKTKTQKTNNSNQSNLPPTNNNPNTNATNSTRPPTSTQNAQAGISQPTAGKTILKLTTTESMKLPHPGPIFPHPTKPTNLTLMCCRSAFEGHHCPYNPCKFYHFPSNLTTVPANVKKALQDWIKDEQNVTWTTKAQAWGAASPGN